ANDPYFRPSNPVTRGQLAKIVSNSAGFSDPVSGQTFEDVVPGSAFYTFIERLVSREVMGGYACGGAGEPCGNGNLPYFRPGSGATRGQLTKIVSNAAGFSDPAPATYTFTDVPVGSTFHVYVERLLLNRSGVMGGYSCGGAGEPCDQQNRAYFRPSNALSRGQTSKIVGNTFYPNCETPAKAVNK
ncbi:MAG: S-layer homology domain-containing protein, partial [Chloroflexia bacterium]